MSVPSGSIVFIILIIILVYCLVLKVNTNYILLAGAILVGIFFCLLTLGFLYAGIGLLFSKRKEARFTRLDHFGNSKYQVAYYLVEGEEYPCIFPKESILEDKLYQKDKVYYVMWNKRMQKVYDRFAIMTCVLGLIFSIGLSVGMLFIILGF